MSRRSSKHPADRVLGSAQVVGIDVGRDTLHVALRPSGASRTFANTDAGCASLMTWLAASVITCTVVESTGSLHERVVAAFQEATLPISVVNAAFVKYFARSFGHKAKTDPLDAMLLAQFAEQRHPDPDPIPSANQRHLKALVRGRADLVAIQTITKLQARATHDPFVQGIQTTLLAGLKTQIAQLTAEIATVIAADPVLAHKAALLQSMPGIGPVISAVLLAELPELGTVDRKRIASLAGLAPHPNQSGTLLGRSMIGGGRAAARTALYQMVTTGKRHHAILGARYTHLKEDKHKPHKVAMIAVARWMLGILTVMLRDDVCWEQTRAAHSPEVPPLAPAA